MGSFWAKYILFELKKYRGVIFHETEEGYKIWRGINSSFQHWHKEFDKIWPEPSKISKIFILLGSFWAKYIFFELKKYRGIIFHETEKRYKIWRGIDLSFRNTKAIYQNLTQALESLRNYHFNGLLLSKVYILWTKKVQRNNFSWNWREIENLERNRLVVSKLA